MKDSLLCAVVLVMAANGCQERIGDFTLISTKNMDLSNLNFEAAGGNPISEGVNTVPIIGAYENGVPSLEEAIDRAIESGRGTALIDASIYMSSWWIPYIYGERTIRVRGKVIR